MKDLATLVRGFAEAKKSVPGLKLIIAGEGAERPNLEALASELGVADSVTLGRLAGRHGRVLRRAGHQYAHQHLRDLPLRHNRGRGAPPAHGLQPSRRHTEAHRGRRQPAISSSPATMPRSASALRRLASDARLRERLGNAIFERAARGPSPWRPPAASSARCTVRYSTARRTADAPGCSSAGPTVWATRADEAILDAITAEIALHRPSHAHNRPLPATRRALKKRLGCGRDTHLQMSPGFLRVMRRRTLYINGGGSLIQDVTSRRSLWFYLFTLRAARRCGCPRDDVRLRHRAGKEARRRAQHAQDAQPPA